MKQKKLSEGQVEEIKEARKANQNKKIERRLQVLEMHGEGKSQKEIQAVTGFCRSYINKIIKTYVEEGISAVGEAHYQGNRRNLSFEEEAEVLTDEQLIDPGYRKETQEVPDDVLYLPLYGSEGL